MSMLNPSKFKIAETCSNSNGKTSASGFAGLVLVLIGSVCFLSSMIGYFMKMADTLTVMQNVVFVIGLGTALLGVRKVFGKGGTIDIVNSDDPKVDHDSTIGDDHDSTIDDDRDNETNLKNQ